MQFFNTTFYKTGHFLKVIFYKIMQFSLKYGNFSHCLYLNMLLHSLKPRPWVFPLTYKKSYNSWNWKKSENSKHL
jgi:hypothetical protein